MTVSQQPTILLSDGLAPERECAIQRMSPGTCITAAVDPMSGGTHLSADGSVDCFAHDATVGVCQLLHSVYALIMKFHPPRMCIRALTTAVVVDISCPRSRCLRPREVTQTSRVFLAIVKKMNSSLPVGR